MALYILKIYRLAEIYERKKENHKGCFVYARHHRDVNY